MTPLGEMLLRAIDQAPAPQGGGLHPAKMPPDRVRAFWDELTPPINETIARARETAAAKGLRLQGRVHDINLTVTCEGPRSRAARLGAYISPPDAWILAETATFANTGSKNLMHLGVDSLGAYWGAVKDIETLVLQ
ncbi:MAG: hypothetical protein ABIX28_08385 [Vicinamibacterales bacterium]